MTAGGPGLAAMSFMLEVYYRAPVDISREQSIENIVKSLGGDISFREHNAESLCLTCEFAARRDAEQAEAKLRESGEHTEGIQDYGDD